MNFSSVYGLTGPWSSTVCLHGQLGCGQQFRTLLSISNGLSEWELLSVPTMVVNSLFLEQLFPDPFLECAVLQTQITFLTQKDLWTITNSLSDPSLLIRDCTLSLVMNGQEKSSMAFLTRLSIPI